MPPKHSCNQWDRISKIENLLDPETGIVMDKLKSLAESQDKMNQTLEKFIATVDEKYVKKESFELWMRILWGVSLILGVISAVIAFTK